MNLQRLFDYQPMTLMTAVRTGLLGFVAGVMTWLVLIGLRDYVLTPIFCTTATTYCQAVPMTAVGMSLIAVHFVALVVLIRLGVIRPLLIVLAVIASLWGFQVWVGAQPWWIAMVYAGLLFGLAYSLYAWLNRMLSFPIALVVTVAVFVIARLVVTA